LGQAHPAFGPQKMGRGRLTRLVRMGQTPWPILSMGGWRANRLTCHIKKKLN